MRKAAQEGRRLQEEVRIAGPRGEPARWLRLRVRPLGDPVEAGASVWTVADVTRDRERQENVFQELQHAIDYLDHAPAGFFSVDGRGDIVYLNATLAGWLDYDLAQVGSGGLRLSDILPGDTAALLTTLSAHPGEVKTEVLDLDLRRRDGRTLPVRLHHKVAFASDATPGASRTLVLNRAADDGSDPQRTAEVRFMRFFHNTPMAIATVDRRGRIARTNAPFAQLVQSVLKGEPAAQGRSILGVVAERDRLMIEEALAKAAGGRADVAPVDAALTGEGERWARFYVTPVEEAENDAETAIVYAIETTDQRELQRQARPGAEDGHGRQARRRHRPRLQQRALRHHDGDRLPAQRVEAERSVVPGHHADQAERQPGGEPGAAAARLLAAPDAAAAGARSRRRRFPTFRCCCAG